MVRSCTVALLFVALAMTFASAQVTIAPDRLPDAAVGANFYMELHASGGTTPYRWTISGQLPPGMTFDAPSATLTGIPEKAGDYRLSISVRDSAANVSTKQYVLRVTTGGLEIVWTKAPAVANGGISGEVEITNSGREAFDLTFICVAVNETGRATALGYQHFAMKAGKQKIPFGSNLPRGTYVVHADSVAEYTRTGAIQRARLQTNALVVP
jgi:Putative Ig domain